MGGRGEKWKDARSEERIDSAQRKRERERERKEK
jgi:hypothetical protein